MSDIPEKKAILLTIIDKIKKASSDAVEIMRKKPICNLRVISRNAKNTKDPNPLQTTMSVLSTKYPLSVDREMVRKYQVPSELIAPDKEDTHQHGRCLAKMEIIDWWVSKSPLPSQETMEVIDILRRGPREEADLYFSLNWSGTHIRFGPVSLERKIVRQRSGQVIAGAATRTNAILQSIASDSVVPYEKVSPDIMDIVQRLIKTSLHSKLIFSQQARILASQLNPKYTYAPALPGSSDVTGPLRHAICQGSWALIGYNQAPLEKSNEKYDALGLLCKAVVKRFHQEPECRKMLLQQIKGTTILGSNLQEVISDPTVRQTHEIAATRSLLKLPIDMEHEIKGTTFCPNPSVIKARFAKTAGGASYKKYSGKELVNFKHGDTRGQFEHDEDLLISITSNLTTLTELRDAIASIAVYIRLWFNRCPATSFLGACDWAYSTARKEPWNVVFMSHLDWKRLPTLGEFKGRVLAINPESEYMGRQTAYTRLTDKLEIVDLQTGQEMRVPIPSEDIIIPATVVAPVGPLDEMLEPKARIERLIKFYLTHKMDLMSRVKANDFCWKNSCIGALNTSATAKLLAASARHNISAILEDAGGRDLYHYPLLAWNYCFASLIGYTGTDIDFSMSMEITPGLLVDLTANDGIFKRAKGKYTLFNKPVTTEMKRFDSGNLLHGVLPGYSLSCVIDPSLPVRTIRQVLEGDKPVRDRERFRIFLGHREYVASRSGILSLASARTINRHVTAFHRSLLFHKDPLENTRKRGRGPEAPVIPEKKAKSRLEPESDSTSSDMSSLHGHLQDIVE